MTIFLGADHAGFAYKERVKKWLTARKIDWQDLGNDTLDERDDYPKFAAAVARAVVKDKTSLGLLICGTGTGMCMAANKISGSRAACPASVKAARLSREHNAANILCLGQRLLTWRQASRLLSAWLETPASFEARHLRRIKQLDRL